MLASSRDKNEGTRADVGREEEGPRCDPGSELPQGGSARVMRGYEQWDENKKRRKGTLLLPYTAPLSFSGIIFYFIKKIQGRQP